MSKTTGILLIVAAVVVAVVFSAVPQFRPLSGLESVLLQIFSLGIGLLGSLQVMQEGGEP
jgi:hypothetical protein